MNDLDYLRKNKLQKMLHGAAKFFRGIPGKLLGMLKGILSFFVSLFTGLGRVLKDIVMTYVRGDWKTRVSYTVMGFGSLMRGQWLRGLLFFAFQTVFNIYLWYFGIGYVSKLGTLGTLKSYSPDGNTIVYGDNSFLILLYGVLTFFFILAFFYTWYANIKQNRMSEELLKAGKSLKTAKDDVTSMLDGQFHKTLLALPTLGVTVFTILPIVFMILVAFTNYDKTHAPPTNLFTWVGMDNVKTLLSGTDSPLIIDANTQPDGVTRTMGITAKNGDTLLVRVALEDSELVEAAEEAIKLPATTFPLTLSGRPCWTLDSSKPSRSAYPLTLTLPNGSVLSFKTTSAEFAQATEALELVKRGAARLELNIDPATKAGTLTLSVPASFVTPPPVTESPAPTATATPTPEPAPESVAFAVNTSEDAQAMGNYALTGSGDALAQDWLDAVASDPLNVQLAVENGTGTLVIGAAPTPTPEPTAEPEIVETLAEVDDGYVHIVLKVTGYSEKRGRDIDAEFALEIYDSQEPAIESRDAKNSTVVVNIRLEDGQTLTSRLPAAQPEELDNIQKLEKAKELLANGGTITITTDYHEIVRRKSVGTAGTTPYAFTVVNGKLFVDGAETSLEATELQSLQVEDATGSVSIDNAAGTGAITIQGLLPAAEAAEPRNLTVELALQVLEETIVEESKLLVVTTEEESVTVKLADVYEWNTGHITFISSSGEEVALNIYGVDEVDTPSMASTFRQVLLWTLIWAFFATFLNYFLGMMVAIMINKKGIKFKKLWRTILVMTIAIPQFISLLYVSKMFAPDGLINGMLMSWGWIESPLPFWTNTTWARITVIIVNVWIGIPYLMLIATGILMNIPADLYESARIDGANVFQTYMKITLPYMLFVTGPYLLTSFTGNINNFNVIFLLSGGKPTTMDLTGNAGGTDLLITWLYRMTVTDNDYKLAAVLGILVFVVCAVINLVVYNLIPSVKNEEDFQ